MALFFSADGNPVRIITSRDHQGYELVVDADYGKPYQTTAFVEDHVLREAVAGGASLVERDGIPEYNEHTNPSGVVNLSNWTSYGGGQTSALVGTPVRELKDGEWAVRQRVIPIAGLTMIGPWNQVITTTTGERWWLYSELKWFSPVAMTASSADMKIRQSTNVGGYIQDNSVLGGGVAAPEDVWIPLGGAYTVTNPSVARVGLEGWLTTQDYSTFNYNAVRNPSAETNLTDINGFNGTTGGTGMTGPTLTRVTTDAASGGGTACAEWNGTTPTSGSTPGSVYVAMFHQQYSSLANLQATSYWTSSGQPVFARASVKTVNALPAGASFTLSVRFHDAAGTYITQTQVGGTGTVPSRLNPAAGTWYDLYGTVTTPANAAYAIARIDCSGLTDGVTYQLRTDNVQVRRVTSSSFTPPYIDGSSPNAVWSGTAHGSLSGNYVDVWLRKTQIVRMPNDNRPYPPYFDGDTGAPYVTAWEGTPNASRSYRLV